MTRFPGIVGLLAVAAATSAAAPPADAPEQFYCSAEASGEGGVGAPSIPTVQMQLLDTAATLDELAERWAGLTVEARSADNVASYPLVRPSNAVDFLGWLVLEAPLEVLGPEYAGKVRITVTDAAGRAAAAFESDLSQTAQRDRLFRKAQHEAARKARTPDSCDPTASPASA